MKSFRGCIAGWIGYTGKMENFRVTFHPFGEPAKKKTVVIEALHATSARNKVKRKYGKDVCCSVSWGDDGWS